PWTYLVFGLASVFSFVFSILILMNQRRKEFGDSQELVQQLVEIVADASLHRSRLSILYPCPNPGQWDSLFRRRKAFGRLRTALQNRCGIGLETYICMLAGSPEVEATALGNFIAAFHNATFVHGELIPGAEGTPLSQYQTAAKEFFDELHDEVLTFKYIHEAWLPSIMNNQLVILAAGHSLGFVGYMSLESGVYRFKALPFEGSAGFLHGLFDALASLYEKPPANASKTKTEMVGLNPTQQAAEILKEGV
ncbi:MAG: hypothetical protein AABP62_17400, partial [Planctomycetota bacterium]